MKTKTNSFTKVINFCVLAFFLIINMIFFTSCDNGNSPNDNINQQQNNNSQTDYCEICDGLQTENCGIKHKCDDENCVEYSANKIYKNGHTHDYCNEDGCLLDDSVRHTTHDYCLEADCDGSTHMGADHPTTDTSWFKETPIGSEDSPYKVFVIDNNAYNEQDEFKSLTTDNVADKLNDFQDQYQKYIEDLKFSDAFKTKFSDAFDENGKLKINFADFFDNTDISTSGKIRYQRSFDPLIGHYDENDKSMNGSLNDICKPMIQEITKNIGITSNNPEDMELDKVMFKLYYRAIDNEVYNYANSGTNTYTEEKDNIEYSLSYANQTAGTSYKIYKEDGTIHQEALQRFDEMITAAAKKLQEQNKQVTVDDLYNIINLSFTASAIQGTHDYDASSINHSISGTCTENEMVNVISGTNLLTKAKLNKSIFSHDYGRELV